VLFDLSGLDLLAKVAARGDIEKHVPHRGAMLLIDGIVWHAEGFVRGVGVKHVKPDEFWCAGHFPGKPIYPGVLQVESAAQLAAYFYYCRYPDAGLSVFCKIEEATFRSMVVPGDDLLLLCQDVRVGRRRFLCDVQGVVKDRVTFEGRILGMSLS
jgi:3-hydroxymyristoyl/3-hydroxydecanoyl-(acyl carrier protein) dehydratase